MNVAEFLRAVWPATGYFALAIPWTPPGVTTALFVHKVVQSHDDAIRTAARLAPTADVYVCVQTLAEPRVWNPKKKNRKTGKPGAYEVRTQRNMYEAKCVVMDIDVGPDDHKYRTQVEALRHLKEFTAAAIRRRRSSCRLAWACTSTGRLSMRYPQRAGRLSPPS